MVNDQIRLPGLETTTSSVAAIVNSSHRIASCSMVLSAWLLIWRLRTAYLRRRNSVEVRAGGRAITALRSGFLPR